MNSNKLVQHYIFPVVIGNLGSDQSREMSHAFISEGNKITEIIIKWFESYFSSKVVGPRLKFFLELSLTELLANIAKHDMLNVHGADAEIFLSNNWQGRDSEFLQKFKDAMNLQSIIVSEISEESFLFSYTLSRPFNEFLKKWREAKEYDPNQEVLETTCGNGLVTLASFFDEAFYDEVAMKISFTRFWKDDEDWIV